MRRIFPMAASSWRPVGSSNEWGFVMGILLDALAIKILGLWKSVLSGDSGVRDRPKPCRFSADPVVRHIPF
jgi:hypothetical protein